MTGRPNTLACPALLVAAPASGQGKTTVVAALARLHTRLGRRVRVFKCGPDFLDPQIHAIASGQPCYNLDLWMCGEAEARRFYRQHRVKMEAGAEVSWPASRPLYRLMCLRAEDREAFDSEQQNDPLSANEAPFNGCITFWVDRSRDWLLFGAVDPSLGKQGAGRDPSAILVGGFLRGSMTLDVVEASIRKRHPDRIIEDVIALHDVHHPLLWGVEAVQFQEFFAHVLVQRAAERGIALPVRPLVNSADKLLRIESLQPHMAQGRIRLHVSQQALIDQLRHFPRADHDDGPDALEMLWRLASTGFVSMGDAYIRMPLEREWGNDGEDGRWGGGRGPF